MANPNNRYLSFHCPSCSSELLIQRISGDDFVSGLFAYQARLLSTDADIDFSTVVGKNATVTMLPPPGATAGTPTRYINGVITSFASGMTEGGFAVYQATLSPWPWLLTLNRRMRIFENKTINEIISEVTSSLTGSNEADKIQVDLKATYPSMEYCVQYRESDFDFLSRWFEKLGIIYYFTHEDGAHTWNLVDDSTAIKLPTGNGGSSDDKIPLLPTNSVTNGMKAITDWSKVAGVRSGQVSLNDYNYLNVSSSLETVSKTSVSLGDSGQGIYEYPGDHQLVDAPEGGGTPVETGFSTLWGQPMAKVQMQAIAATESSCQGKTFYTPLNAGYPFMLLLPAQTTGTKYLVLKSHFSAAVPDYQSTESPTELTYEATFTCIEQSVRYYALPKSPWPSVQGPQSAKVVGSSANANVPDCDEYGRVKVAFIWDTGETKTQTIYLRVAQPWAGGTHGTLFIPEIGDEVVVEFMEGNPDRPIITGSVYNGSNRPANELPSKKRQMILADDANNVIGMDSSTADGPYIQVSQATANDGKNNYLLMDATSGSAGVKIGDYYGNYIHLDAVGKELKLYSPNNSSYISIGPEGIKMTTGYTDPNPEPDSTPINSFGTWNPDTKQFDYSAKSVAKNLWSQIEGTWTDYTLGIKSSTVLGWYQSTNLGAKTEITIPWKKTFVMGIGESKVLMGPFAWNTKTEFIGGSKMEIRTGKETKVTAGASGGSKRAWLAGILWNGAMSTSSYAALEEKRVAATAAQTAAQNNVDVARNSVQTIVDNARTGQITLDAARQQITVAKRQLRAAENQLTATTNSLNAVNHSLAGMSVKLG